jgi:hypothetical protein
MADRTRDFGNEDVLRAGIICGSRASLQLGPQHPDTLASRHLLAQVLHALGRSADALPIIEDVKVARQFKPEVRESARSSASTCAACSIIRSDFRSTSSCRNRSTSPMPFFSLIVSSSGVRSLNGAARFFRCSQTESCSAAVRADSNSTRYDVIRRWWVTNRNPGRFA